MPQDLRILIVENQPDDTDLAVRELRSHFTGITTEQVATLAALEEALRRSSWDLLLASHSLSGFCSTNVLALVQRVAPPVPAIVISGEMPPEEAAALILAGAAHVVHRERLSGLAEAVKGLLPAEHGALPPLSGRVRTLLSRVTDRLPEGLALVTPAMQILYRNPAWVSLCGDAIRFEDCWRPDDWQRLVEPALLQNGEPTPLRLPVQLRRSPPATADLWLDRLEDDIWFAFLRAERPAGDAELRRRLVSLSHRAALDRALRGTLHNMGVLLSRLAVQAGRLHRRARTGQPGVSPPKASPSNQLAEDAAELEETVRAVLDLFRNQYVGLDGAEPQSATMQALLEDALLAMQERLEEAGIGIERDFAAVPEVHTDTAGVKRALIVVLRDVCTALGGASRSMRRLRLSLRHDGAGRIKIRLTHNGSGGAGQGAENLFRLASGLQQPDGGDVSLRNLLARLGGNLTATSAAAGLGTSIEFEFPAQLPPPGKA